MADQVPRWRERQQQAAGAELGSETARGVGELQEALLPATLPVLPQAQIAACYLAAEQAQAAGGDWFDAIPLADGTVALMVGDVAGHGLAASVAMGKLRSVLDELLASEPGLGTVLARAEAFAARTPALWATTVALVVLDPGDGTLRYATFGHPPPLIIGTGGTARFLRSSGAGPLGTGSSPSLATITLQPRELVLLYSDGLIGRPDRSVAEGMADLRKSAVTAAHQGLSSSVAPTLADRVCQATVELLTRTGYADDVTILAAQRLAEPVAPLHLKLPAELASVTQARHAFGAWLDQVDPAAQDRGDLQLAIAEVVTNAVEHAYPADRPGPVELWAALRGDGTLECQIVDYGSWRVPDPAATDRGHGLMVAGQVVDQLRISHPPQPAAVSPGAGRTVVRLQHRLRRPARLSSGTSAGGAVGHWELPFTVDISTDGGVPRARAAGPVDTSTSGQFVRKLLTASHGGTLPLTVDLTSVTRLASVGIRALYQVREQLAAHGQNLTLLAAPGSSVALILELAHLPHATGTAGDPP
jgi:serine phosphatase RsbU (regulator of sigma subunit)/anti-sigma regulatory factor (Ser/Thr protein kinase)/anti-anti-sigma regulatory factor